MEGGRDEQSERAASLDGSEGRSVVPLLDEKGSTGTSACEEDLERGEGLDLRRRYLPAWVLQTKDLFSKELLGMEDTERLQLLSEDELKEQRTRKKRFWGLLAIPLLLLIAYGAWSVGSGVEDSETWRESFGWHKESHEIRQTNGREKYLVGVGKADITG
ncbi:MAG: hypothetical protein H9W83_00880 [Leuconostoc sp.]|nr:hypothetical protein [Leuconostoc sp.]